MDYKPLPMLPNAILKMSPKNTRSSSCNQKAQYGNSTEAAFHELQTKIICRTNNDHLQVRTQNCCCYRFTVSYKCPTNGISIFTILSFSAFYTDHLFQRQTDALQGKCHQSMLCRLLNIFHHYIDFFQVSDKKKNGRPDLTWPTF